MTIGKLFKWNERRRDALQTQMDASFFLAYRFDMKNDEDGILHILNSFPIWNREKPKYANLVLNYVRAYRFGKFDALIRTQVVESTH